MAFFLVETGDCILERPGGAIGVSEQLGNCFLKIVFYSLETKKEKKNTFENHKNIKYPINIVQQFSKIILKNYFSKLFLKALP